MNFLESGEVLCFDLENYQKVQTNLLFNSLKGITIKQIACGSNYWLFLSGKLCVILPFLKLSVDSGQIYAQGANSEGQVNLDEILIDWVFFQLGFPETTSEINEAALVPLPLEKSELVTLISSGGRHCVVATSSNRIFSWGSNKNGRCGVGSNTEIIYEPKQVPLTFPNGEPPKSLTILCGW